MAGLKYCRAFNKLVWEEDSKSHDDEILLGIEEEVWLSGEGTQLEPGDPEFKSSSDHRMHSFNSLAVP